MIFQINPVSKPRMTRSDRWKKRKCVLNYFSFKDKVRELGISVENGDHIIFHIPMAYSWSKKKKEEMDGKPHQQKPDIDNLAKALLDAVHDDDAHIWDLRITKRWSHEGIIEIWRE